MFQLTIKITFVGVVKLLIFNATSYANAECISSLNKEKFLHDIFHGVNIFDDINEIENNKKSGFSNVSHDPKAGKLIRAALEGDIQKVKYFIKRRGMDVNTHHFALGYTALQMAAAEGHVKLVDVLIKMKNINVDEPDATGITSLMESAMGGETNHIKIAETLIEHNADVNKKDIGGWTALMYAASIGNSKMTKFLADIEGIKINSINNEKETALMLAKRRDHTKIIDILSQY